MKRGLLAALRRLRYWGMSGDGDTDCKRQVRKDVQQIESELRSTFDGDLLEYVADCAGFAELHFRNDPSESEHRRAFFDPRIRAVQARVKQIREERFYQLQREKHGPHWRAALRAENRRALRRDRT